MNKKEESKQSSDSEIRNLFIGIALVLLVFFATAAFVKNLSKPKIEVEYSNGFTFTKQGSFWHTDIKNAASGIVYDTEFRYAPSEVTAIPVDRKPESFFTILNLNNLTAAYFTFNPNQNLSGVNLVAADLSRFLNSIHGVTLVAACTINETAACESRPIVTCENQLNKAMVIYVKEASTPKISMNKNCLVIEGTGQDLVKAQNKLMFLWYGIL